MLRTKAIQIPHAERYQKSGETMVKIKLPVNRKQVKNGKIVMTTDKDGKTIPTYEHGVVRGALDFGRLTGSEANMMLAQHVCANVLKPWFWSNTEEFSDEGVLDLGIVDVKAKLEELKAGQRRGKSAEEKIESLAKKLDRNDLKALLNRILASRVPKIDNEEV